MFIFKGLLIALVFLLNIEGAVAQVSAPYSLEDCYHLTIERSENLKIRDEQVVISEQQYKEALSSLYPNLSVGYEYRRRDNSNFGRINRGSSNQDDPSTPIGGTGGILGKTQAGAVVTVSQPLFNGFREFLLSDAAKVEGKALKLDARRSRELLYLDVSDIYHQILFTDSEVAVLKKSKKTLNKRVGELREFINLGKSRESEVLAAMSELAELETSLVQLEGLKNASKELLAFLTGVPSSELALGQKSQNPNLKPLDEYLISSQSRADLKASQQRIKAQKKRVTAAEREYWPALNLLGYGYTLQDPDRSREWELVFQLDLPIFDGGRIDARTAIEESELQIAKLENSEKSRLIDRDIRVAYANTVSKREELASLKKLKQAASKNYDVQQKDYSNGVVTNLEVLQAIKQLQEIDRRLVRVEQTYLSNLTQLAITSGGVPE